MNLTRLNGKPTLINPPILELRWAANSLEQMKTTEDLVEYERHWKEFLSNLERFWKKVFVSKLIEQKRISEIGQLRKRDPLLQYLLHARNSNEHTIRPIVEVIQGAENGGTSITGGEGGGTIQRGVIIGGQLPNIETSGNLIIRFGVDRMEALPVFDSGITYAVPDLHLEKTLPGVSPNELAAVGLAYYQSALQEFR